MKGRRYNRVTCLMVWCSASIFLFFCIFGSTDSEGFHHGWFVTTRPGWLFSLLLFYTNVVLVGLVFAWLISKKPQAKQTKKRAFTTVMLIVAIVLVESLAIWAGLCWDNHVLYGPHARTPRLNCIYNLKNLGTAIYVYHSENNGQYPTSAKWCDLLVQHTAVDEIDFKCPRDKKGPSSYAMNKYVDEDIGISNSVVLLFESQPGWNRAGGPELLNTENHGGDGCNIFFTDGHVEFVSKERFCRLKWNGKQDVLTYREE